MIAPGIAAVCTDTNISEADLKAYAAAQTKQFAEACDIWSRVPIVCALYGTLREVPLWMPVIVIQEDMDEPGALAYHTEEGDRVDGMVGTKICREAGVPWQSAASHEALEAAFNAYVGGWEVLPSGRALVSREICDPVQDGMYEIDGVPMSNYIYPTWFDPTSRGEKYDRMGMLKAPFTRSPGGYWVEMAAGKTSQVGAARITAGGRGARALETGAK